jgi:hypothetical protein
MYCASCGASHADNASFCKECGKAIAGAPAAATAENGSSGQKSPGDQVILIGPEPVRQKRRKSRKVWIGVGVVAAIVLILVLISVSGPDPEVSLNQARIAYLQHDQANFDKYVDVQSVLSDWADQAGNEWVQEEKPGLAARLVVQGGIQAAKSAYLPNLSQWVDHFVISGSVTQQPQSSTNDTTDAFLAGLFSSGLRTLASSQLTYEGLASKTISGSTALLNVNLHTPLSTQPVVVKIAMQRVGDHWRVVSIQDLPSLFQQLGQS